VVEEEEGGGMGGIKRDRLGMSLLLPPPPPPSSFAITNALGRKMMRGALVPQLVVVVAMERGRKRSGGEG